MLTSTLRKTKLTVVTAGAAAATAQRGKAGYVPEWMKEREPCWSARGGGGATGHHPKPSRTEEPSGDGLGSPTPLVAQGGPTRSPEQATA